MYNLDGTPKKLRFSSKEDILETTCHLMMLQQDKLFESNMPVDSTNKTNSSSITSKWTTKKQLSNTSYHHENIRDNKSSCNRYFTQKVTSQHINIIVKPFNDRWIPRIDSKKDW